MNKKYASCLISGMLGTMIFQPIDALRSISFFEYKNFTFKGLYNGFLFNCSTNILKVCSSYPTQEFIKSKVSHLPEIQRETLSGLLTGSVLTIVSTPANVIKTPLISDQTNKMIPIIKKTYGQYGLKGFYRGGIGTLLRDVVWSGIYFPTFYYINKKLNGLNKYFDNRPVASVLSAALAACISYPFDGIRLYRQNEKQNYNFWYGFKYSFNRTSANLKSFMWSMLRVPFSIALSHYVYLRCNDWFEHRDYMNENE